MVREKNSTGVCQYSVIGIGVIQNRRLRLSLTAKLSVVPLIVDCYHLYLTDFFGSFSGSRRNLYPYFCLNLQYLWILLVKFQCVFGTKYGVLIGF